METRTPNGTRSEHTSKASVVDAVFDAALEWADAGLGYVKTSLVASARAIERTASALDSLRDKLRA